MSITEFRQWAAYDELYGLPDPWLQTGMACAVTATVMGSKKHKPQDFMPPWKKTKAPSMKNIMAALQQAAPRGSKEKLG